MLYQPSTVVTRPRFSASIWIRHHTDTIFWRTKLSKYYRLQRLLLLLGNDLLLLLSGLNIYLHTALRPFPLRLQFDLFNFATSPKFRAEVWHIMSTFARQHLHPILRHRSIITSRFTSLPVHGIYARSLSPTSVEFISFPLDT